MKKINGRDLLKMAFPNIKIPKRRSERAKMNALRRGVSSRGISLIHKDSLDSCPKGKHLWWLMPNAYPASFQTKAGKRMRKIIVDKLKKSNNTKVICERIGDRPIQILIKYLLVNTDKDRDVDNYTKNIIDSLKEGGLFKDDNNRQVRFVASKVNYIEVKDRRYYRAYEKAVIILDFFDETKGLIKEFDSNFKRE
jgi:Holliday junction resolvase RusA-like endonuclease